MSDGRPDYRVKLVRGPFVELPPHQLACESVEELREVVENIERPTAVDLFCGAGGLSLGLTQAGFEVILGIDHDEEAVRTHRAHHPGLSVNWDLGDPEVIEGVSSLMLELEVDLLAGGPPCQPFSRAGRSMMRDLVRTGRRPAHDARRDLWESFLGVIEGALPRAVIMENVPDMALDRGMVILRTMIERLESIGYSVEPRILESWRFGIPQRRQRLILVALRDGVSFEWPKPATAQVSLRSAIDDLPEVAGGWRPRNGDGEDPVASGWAPYGGPRSSFQRSMRSQVPDRHSARIYDHITRPVREDDRLAFRQMTHETRYSDLDPELKRYRDDIFDDKYKRLNWDDVSRTITAHIAKDGYWYIHPEQERTLTVREAARIQTFPDWFRFSGPPSAAFRQIGNAVPVMLGRLLGEAVLRSLGSGQEAPYSTGEIAGSLARWFDRGSTHHVPWLRAESRWQVIQAEFLWARMTVSESIEGWRAVQGLKTPEATIRALPLLRYLLDSRSRSDRLEPLSEMAHWFHRNPDLLDASVPASQLRKCPHLTTSVADLACRVIPGETEDPVLAGFGVLRVAARVLDLPVDQRNKLTDGRLALARMIARDEHAHSAHLALIEIAAGVCTPRAPECGLCPLESVCAFAQRNAVQGSLDLTTRGSERSGDQRS